MVNYEKNHFFILLVVFFIGIFSGKLCGNLLQTAGKNLSGNSSVHRGQFIDKSTVTEQSNRVETTTKDIESGSSEIARTNQDIKRTADSIGELLQEQRRLLSSGKRNLETAVRIDEKEK